MCTAQSLSIITPRDLGDFHALRNVGNRQSMLNATEGMLLANVTAERSGSIIEGLAKNSSSSFPLVFAQDGEHHAPCMGVWVLILVATSCAVQHNGWFLVVIRMLSAW